MWYYRFRDSAPFDKRVVNGYMIKKHEWTKVEVKVDFGAFTRFMESRNDPARLMDTVSTSKKKEEPKEEKVEKKSPTKSSRGRKKKVEVKEEGDNAKSVSEDIS